MIRLPKPVRIFYRPVMYVPQIDLSMVCERGFISKQNVSRERIIILQLMKCKLTKFQVGFDVLTAVSMKMAVFWVVARVVS
jgi:hypothetical protein